MEQALGVRDCPARVLYDYAQQHFIDGKLPVVFLQTVTTRENDVTSLNGLYIGDSRVPFEKACELAQELNIVHVERRARRWLRTWIPRSSRPPGWATRASTVPA